jgi:hypothetical protein
MIGERNNLDAFGINHSARIDAWLDIATRGLCEPALARITAEVEDYYASAVEDARDKGFSEPDANEVALERLGSARRARHRFRHDHLTRHEARAMSMLLRWPRQWPVRWRHLALVGLPFILCLVLSIVAVWYLGRESYAALAAPVVVIAGLLGAGLAGILYRLGRRVTSLLQLTHLALAWWTLWLILAMFLTYLGAFWLAQDFIMYGRVSPPIAFFFFYYAYETVRAAYILLITMPKIYRDRTGQCWEDVRAILEANGVQRRTS